MKLSDANSQFQAFLTGGLTSGQQLFEGSHVYSFVKDDNSPCKSGTIEQLSAAVKVVTASTKDVWKDSISPVLAQTGVSSVVGDVTGWLSSNFILSRLDVAVDDTMEVEFVSFDLACQLKGKILDDNLEITSCVLQVACGRGFWNAALVIDGKFFGMPCEASIALPSLEIEIESTDSTGSLSEILTGPGAAGLADVFGAAAIDSFSAVANVTGKSFAVSVRSSGLIKTQAFDLLGAEISFAHQIGGASTFAATAVMNVGGVGVELDVEYDGSSTIFCGSADVNCDLNLADFVKNLANVFDPAATVPDLPDLQIHSVVVRLEKPTSGAVSFMAGCAGAMQFDDTGSSLSFDVEVSKSNGDLEVTLILGGQRLTADKGSGGYSAFSLKPIGGPLMLSLLQLARLLRIQLLEDADFDLSVAVNGIFIAAGPTPLGDPPPPRPLLFGIRFGLDAKLDDAVLKILTGGGGGVGLKDVTLLVANQPWTGADLGKIPGDKGGIELPIEMPKGPHVQATLEIGSSSVTAPLSAPSAPPPTPNDGGAPPTGPVAANTDSPAHWFNVQKKVGPLYLSRVGLELDRDGGVPRLGVLVDGSCTVAVLTLALQGLEVSVPIKSPFVPEFSLRGLEIDYQSGPVSIGGGLLHVEDHVSDLYVGDAHITTATFNLIAVGEYGTFTDGNNDKHTTLFIFAVLDYPLGGPAFAFVTGLAAGFGYNSHLRIPTTLDELTQFPLIKGCQPKQKTFSPGAGTQDVLTQFTSWITPQADQIWLAAGVMFRSFEMIETLALLTVEFGKEFQVALFGRSQMTIPPNAPEKLAYAELDVMATFDPQAGALKVLGVLSPNSWVIAPECHLSGGFAFCLWESGKFIVTYGGYHPRFDYAALGFPAVPRLQLYWQLDSHTQVKGSEYFALTGGAMMAGGGLEATWQSGAFSASFQLTADFLMEWRPFHFEADLSMSIAVEFTLKIAFISTHFSFHLGVAVHLEGPPLHGTAEIDLSVVSFTVTFGSSNQETQQLVWKDFLPLLPGYDKAAPDCFVCFAAPKVKVLAGLVEDHSTPGDDTDVGAINPKELLIDIETVVPVNVLNVTGGVKAFMPGASKDDAWTTIDFIRPMNASVTDSTLELKLEKWDEGQLAECKDSQLTFLPAPTPREAPAALWSKAPSNVNQPAIQNVLTLVRVQPSNPSCDRTGQIDVPILLVSEANDQACLFPAAIVAPTVPSGNTSAADVEAALVAGATIRQTVAANLKGAGWKLVDDDLGVKSAATIAADAFVKPPRSMPLC